MKKIPEQKGKIGIFDSGLGGLTILKEVVRLMPNREYLYLGDNLHVPYGDKSREEIYALTSAGVEWLFKNGAEIVILACNTASANALRKIQQEVLPVKYPGKKVLGIIIPTIEEVETFTRSGHVGILATRATVASAIFEIEMKKRNPGIHIVSQTGGRLASFIEKNEDESLLLEEIKNVTDTLLSRDTLIDTVVLGCTHYALIAKQIERILSGKIKVIGQGDIIATKLLHYLNRHEEISKKLGNRFSLHFFTTSSDNRVKEMMAKFYGANISVLTVTCGRR